MTEEVNRLITSVETGRSKAVEGIVLCGDLHHFYEELKKKNATTYRISHTAEIIADLGSNWVSVDPAYFGKAFSGDPKYMLKLGKYVGKTTTYAYLEYKKHHLEHEREHLAGGGHQHG